MAEVSSQLFLHQTLHLRPSQFSSTPHWFPARSDPYRGTPLTPDTWLERREELDLVGGAAPGQRWAGHGHCRLTLLHI